MMVGGVMPGGMMRLAVSITEAICAMAPPMSLPGSNHTLRIPIPLIDCESMREMPLTVVDITRSLMKTTRRSMSSAERPGELRATITTGMSIAGRMSVFIFVVERIPKMAMSEQRTAIV